MSGPTGHSEYSASGFEAAMLCPGKRVMERGKPDSSSSYADEGTCAHAVLELALENNRPAMAYRGRLIPMKDGGAPRTVEVTEEMCEAVQTALNDIARIAGEGMVLSETQVNYSRVLGVEHDEAWGTADVIVAVDNELQVHDYKHGRGVEVFADENPQMMLYALGALEQCDRILGMFETVRMVIHQPRIKHEPSEWVCTTEHLFAWAAGEGRDAVAARQKAALLFSSQALDSRGDWEDMFLVPNEKSCKFCRAKTTCPALRGEATRTVFEIVPAAPDEFDNLAPAEAAKHSSDDWLAKVLSKADMIEDYLKAVRAEVESRLLAGTQIPGYKLVQGKRGHRSWADEKAAEKALVAQLGDRAYSARPLITPTAAEKALGKPGYREHVQALVTQSDGPKHVAPVSDPRPALALTSAADDFQDVSADFA